MAETKSKFSKEQIKQYGDTHNLFPLNVEAMIANQMRLENDNQRNLKMIVTLASLIKIDIYDGESESTILDTYLSELGLTWEEVRNLGIM